MAAVGGGGGAVGEGSRGEGTPPTFDDAFSRGEPFDGIGLAGVSGTAGAGGVAGGLATGWRVGGTLSGKRSVGRMTPAGPRVASAVSFGRTGGRGRVTGSGFRTWYSRQCHDMVSSEVAKACAP